MSGRYFTLHFVIKAGFLLLGSLFFLSAGMALNAASEASRDWSETHGVVLSSRVVEDRQRSGAGGGESACFRADIRYGYRTQGQTYHNDRLTYHGNPCKGGKRGRNLAEELIDRYPPGAAVTIFHDPDDPRRSCLVTGKTGDGTALLFLGGFGLLGLVVFTGGRALDRYGGLGDFVLHNHTGTPIFEETLLPPLRSWIAWITGALLVGSLGKHVLRWLLFPGGVTSNLPDGLLQHLLAAPTWLFLSGCAGLTAFLLLLYGSMTVTYSPAGVLLAPSGPFRPRRLIAAAAVVDCEERPCRIPLFPLFSLFHWKASARTMPLPGYRGPGVLLRYHPGKKGVRAMLSAAPGDDTVNRSLTITIHFPCRRARQLCSTVCPKQ